MVEYGKDMEGAGISECEAEWCRLNHNSRSQEVAAYLMSILHAVD
jgi:hypothetical protein